MLRTNRSLAAAVLCAGALAAGLFAAPGGASAAPVSSPAVAVTADEVEAKAALNRAVRVFSETGSARTSGGSADEQPDATLALRDLFTAMPRLSAQDQQTAQGLLARPTDGGADPQRNGYTTGSQRTCSKKVCVHYVTSTSDAPPSLAWVQKNLQTMQQVYNFEVGKLNYRAPAREPNVPGTGGDARFDVYLKDIGLGIYGYCAPEYLKSGTSSVASGFCVLDNDFASEQFGGANPGTSLKVTAAHEFFHAIQFAYDFREDPWLLESTAAWMEERYADSADDNLQYLARSQVRLPKVPLDLFETNGTYHYGQWAFWEFLSQKHGNKIVKSVINRAAEPARGRNFNSTQALKTTMRKRGGLPRTFAAYAAANTIPQRNYAEGSKWPSSKLSAARRLTKQKRTYRGNFRLDHLSSTSVRLNPAPNLRGKSWKLRVAVDGPNQGAAPAAYVTVVTKRKGLIRQPVSLNKSGKGSVRVPFAASKVKRAFVTVANVSTRTRCNQGSTFACAGMPKDDNQRFRVKATAVR